MGLKREQVKELIKNPRNAQKIKDAQFYQDRLRFHSTPHTSSNGYFNNALYNNEAYNTFVGFLRTLVPFERFERLKQFLGTPIPTTSFIDNIFSNYFKIFETNDYKCDFNFKESEEDLNTDFKEYIKSGVINNWNTLAMEEFRNNICSFMVIDAAKEQVGEKPSPYVNFVSIYKVIDAEINDDNSVEYLIYRSGNKIIQIDDEYYRVFIEKEGEDNSKEVELEKGGEIYHGKGKTPARQYWTTNLADTNEFVKRSTISTSLWHLDELLVHVIAKEYTQMYGKFPIVARLNDGETAEDYENNIGEYSPNSSGDDEFYGSDFYKKSFGYNRDYSKVSDKKNNMLLSGVEIELPMPTDTDPEIKDPVKFIVPPVDSLRYIDDNEDSRKDEIYINAVGALPDFKNDQAKNEKQIESQLEGQKTILDFIQYNIEKAEKWVLEWFGEIRYADKFNSISLDYGKQRFLKTVSDLEGELTSTANESQRFEIVRQINNTKYKNDEYQQKRQDILLSLEPYPTRNILELIELSKAGVNVSDDLFLKANLPQIIKEFERLNGDLVMFLMDNSKSRIEKLKDFIKQKVEDGRPNESRINGRDDREGDQTKREETED